MHVHLNSNSIHIFVVVNSLIADVQGGQKQPLTFVNGGQLKLELLELCAAHIYLFVYLLSVPVWSFLFVPALCWGFHFSPRPYAQFASGSIICIYSLPWIASLLSLLSQFKYDQFRSICIYSIEAEFMGK